MKDNFKFNWKTMGHWQQKKFLEKSISKDMLSQAYLITGSEHIGKTTFALDFIKLLQCEARNKLEKNLPCEKCRSCSVLEKNTHPDVLIIKPEQSESKGVKKEQAIGISEIRKLQHQLALFPYSSPYKIGLILKAEKMTQEAANAILKTLEEPSGKTIIILTAPSESFILPTIVSRCQILKLLSVSQRDIEKALVLCGADYPESQKLAKLSGGNPGLAFEFYKNPEKVEHFFQITKELTNLIQSDYNERYQYIENISKNVLESKEMLKVWLIWFRDLALENLNCRKLKVNINDHIIKNYSIRKIFDIIYSIKETERLISTTNINARLALENLVLKI